MNEKLSFEEVFGITNDRHEGTLDVSKFSVRDQKIKWMHGQGISLAAIAAKFGLTWAKIRDVVKVTDLPVKFDPLSEHELFIMMSELLGTAREAGIEFNITRLPADRNNPKMRDTIYKIETWPARGKDGKYPGE